MIEIIVNPGVVSVVVGLVDAVLNQRADLEIFSEVFTEPCTVKPPVSGKDLQLARVPAGELLADISVTSLSRGRAVQIKDNVRLRIDEFRSFEVLYFVFCLVAVRAARRRALEERGVNRSDRPSVVKISGLLEKRPTDRHLDSIKSETQRRWMRKIGRFKADLPRYLWHLFQKVDCHSVGRIEVNPQTVDGYHRCISEPAAPFWGGRFVPIIGSSFDCEAHSLSEAGD